MPLVNWNDPTVWVSAYSVWTPTGFVSGLLRTALSNPALVNDYTRQMEDLAAAIGLSAASSVVIVGAGFGYRAEILSALLPGIAIDCIDTSQYVQERKAVNSVLVINNDAVTAPGDRNRILRRLSRSATHVITEDVLSSLSDAEAQTFDGQVRAFNVPVCHMVYVVQPGSQQDPRFNWKTGEQWRALLPHQPGGGEPQWICSLPNIAVF